MNSFNESLFATSIKFQCFFSLSLFLSWTEGIFKGYYKLFTTKYTIFPFFFFNICCRRFSTRTFPVFGLVAEQTHFRVRNVFFQMVFTLCRCGKWRTWRNRVQKKEKERENAVKKWWGKATTDTFVPTLDEQQQLCQYSKCTTFQWNERTKQKKTQKIHFFGSVFLA